MKIGVKTFRSEEFLDKFVDDADFFEVQAIQKNKYDFLKKYNKPFVIHAEHQGFGINNADISNKEKNLKSINFAINLANKTNANHIILHPGEIVNNNCSLKNSIDLIKNIDDNRIIIENMPTNKEKLCTTPLETKEFLKKTNKKFCLDFNHAIIYAINNNLDYMDFIKEFLKLKPVHFHLGGQIIKNKSEAHMPLSACDFDLTPLIKLIPKNATVTLETTINISEVKEDIKILKDILKKL